MSVIRYTNGWIKITRLYFTRWRLLHKLELRYSNGTRSYQNLDLAGVDIIELGYKSPVKGGKYRKCNDRFIWEVLGHRLPVNAELAFMIDAKDFIKGSSLDYSLIDDIIHEKDNHLSQSAVLLLSIMR